VAAHKEWMINQSKIQNPKSNQKFGVLKIMKEERLAWKLVAVFRAFGMEIGSRFPALRKHMQREF